MPHFGSVLEHYVIYHMTSHLLVRHHAVGLQWSWMSTEETCSRPVMFTEDGPIDVVKAVARDQAVPAGRAGEALGKKRATKASVIIIKLISR